MNEDERYQLVLAELSKVFQSVQQARIDLSAQQLDYWKAAAGAIRQLSEWQATGERERARTRRRELWLHAIGIGLGLLNLALIVWLIVH